MTSTTLSTRPKHAAASSRNGVGATLLIFLVLLVGVAVMMYPVVSTQYNNLRQRHFAQQYNSAVAEADPGQVAAQVQAAHVYNQSLPGVPILDPYLTKVTQDRTAPYMQYLDQLNATDAMARVRVPTAKIDLPVYHGTSDDVLAKGAGHLYGTSLPVGGPSTHTVLTSHTGMPNATLFDRLVDVKKGDLMYIDVSGQTLTYEVDDITVVLPTQLDVLKQRQGEDLLTLFTCTPYAVNTHRLMVTGHRVPTPPHAASPSGATDGFSVFTLQPWMVPWVILSAVVLAAALTYLTWSLVAIARRRRAKSRPIPPPVARRMA